LKDADSRSDSRRKKFFLTVGAIYKTKNLDFLISSLALRSDKSWPLVIVANWAHAETLSNLQEFADSVGIALDVRVNVSDQELSSLYREAGLFLYSPRLEPFGLTPLEAAAFGLPAVAVAEAGTRESIVDMSTGILTEERPSEFAAAIDRLLGDLGLFLRLGEQAQSRVKSYWTARHAGRRLEELLFEASTTKPPLSPVVR
jgi:glycosyltransferase involved in cell wall biosynthesis